MTLKLRRIFPDGGAAYVADGVRGTIYVKPGFFPKGSVPPDSLTLSGLPGQAVAAPAAAPAEQPLVVLAS
jgi:hypothetical protein